MSATVASNHVVACPVCSSPGFPERPLWWLARRTTASRELHLYFWTGCKHAQAIATSDKIRGADEWDLIQSAWEDWVERAFEARTENWLPVARAALRRTIDGTFLPEDPAQQTTKKNETEHGNENQRKDAGDRRDGDPIEPGEHPGGMATG